jgi:catechol 2,3-dioxygenase-like lactoylglutathione lyase family enzyme
VSNTIRHFGIVVNDLDRALAFWVGLLGWQVRSDVVEPSPFIDQLIAVPNPELRTVKISDQGKVMIELLHFVNREQDRKETWGGTLSSLGPTHVAVTVSNLDLVLEEVEALGFRKISEPLSPPSGAVKVVFVSSPEGLMVELVQETPSLGSK